MKKWCICFIIFCVLLIVLCACMKSGPYPVPLKQSPDAIVKVDLLDGQNETALFEKDTYSNCVIYSLDSSQLPAFIKALQSIEFYRPLLEPSRHLGNIAARIYYADGSSDLIGSNCNYNFDADLNILGRGTSYPDEEAFYAIFSKFIDPQLLP